VLPPTWSRGNPIDIIGDAPVERYTATLRALLDDRDAGTVLFIHAPTAIVRSEDIARACAPHAREAGGRLMACWLGGAAVAEARRIFDEAGIPGYETPEEAVRAFAMLASYQRNQTLLTEAPVASEAAAPDRTRARAIVEAALAAGREMLDEVEAKAVLKAYGIPVVPTVAAGADADSTIEAARAIGFPVALKILSPDISHKSDVGGVVLGLGDDAALRLAAQAMLKRVRGLRPEARITGFTVQSMVRRPDAQELIVGASVDPVFGPVVLFGQGGTAVEVLADRANGLPPLNHELARDLVSATRVAKLLAGYRDHPPARIDAICTVLVAVSQMLADLSELVELDINPLWADGDGVIALDARLRIAPAEGAGTARFAIQPYPLELAETLTWQGQQLLVRPIRPEDEAQHRAFTIKLAPEDLRLRFFSIRRELPRSEMARLVQIDYEREMAFVALEPQPDGTTRTLGVVRAIADPDNVEAEFAIILGADVQRRGLGQLLLDKMIRYLKDHGTQRVVAMVLRENRAMRALATRSGFKVDAALSDSTPLRYVLELRSAVSPAP
jgi:acetyltransferase